MRSNSALALWLTLFMLLLVSAAAVFFLVQRNTELETTLLEAESESRSASVAARSTRNQLLSDVTVREAALDAASATRDALAAEATSAAGRSAELASSLAQEQAQMAEAKATLQSLALQVTIIAPAGNVPVPPLEPLDIMATARADAGLNVLLVSVDGQQIAQLPAEGQESMNVRASWTPPGEGEYLIAVEATGAEGRSERAEVTISAAYASEAAREAALRDQLFAAAGALRDPALRDPALRDPALPTATQPEEQDVVTTQPAGDGQTADAILHRLLLTGRQSDSSLEASDEPFALRALDFVVSDAAYQSYLDRVVAANLAVYVDPESGSRTTYIQDDQQGAFGRWAGLHPFTHELQSEHFGLNELPLAAMDGDRRMAVRALVEGDAIFLQQQMLSGESMPVEQVSDVRVGLADAATDVTATLPAPLRESFEFAYVQGALFVRALHDQGGFESVDGAWRELPASSEQIIHPERYLAGDAPKPVALVPLNAILGQGWRLVDEDTFGEFLLRQHLARQPLTAAQIDLAANGWGGGRYAVYQFADDELPIVVFHLAWDGALDGDEFAGIYADYLNQRYGGPVEQTGEDGRCWQADGVACLFRAGDDSLVIRAPTMVLALAAAEAQLNMSQP